MKKIKLNANAKINLTLDVKGIHDGYHVIKSLVTSVTLSDEITLVKRKDYKIILYTSGLPVGCSVVDNNAYKAAKSFLDTFKTTGVDIYINKRIPIGGGLGGSSADIAGVLNGMKTLYAIDDVTFLANSLGSDSGYMLNGGWAILKGRGDIVESVKTDAKFYLLIISDDRVVSARECYKEFDEMGKTFRGATSKAVDALKKNDVNSFFSALKNDLYRPALKFVPELTEKISALKSVGAEAALMTGSGSSVYGLFLNVKKRNAAYKTLFPIYGEKLVKTETL